MKDLLYAFPLKKARNICLQSQGIHKKNGKQNFLFAIFTRSD